MEAHAICQKVVRKKREQIEISATQLPCRYRLGYDKPRPACVDFQLYSPAAPYKIPNQIFVSYMYT
jgi:hypothetical protein